MRTGSRRTPGVSTRGSLTGSGGGENHLECTAGLWHGRAFAAAVSALAETERPAYRCVCENCMVAIEWRLR